MRIKIQVSNFYSSVELLNNLFLVFKQYYTFFYIFPPTHIAKNYKQHYSNPSTKQFFSFVLFYFYFFKLVLTFRSILNRSDHRSKSSLSLLAQSLLSLLFHMEIFNNLSSLYSLLFHIEIFNNLSSLSMSFFK